MNPEQPNPAVPPSSQPAPQPAINQPPAAGPAAPAPAAPAPPMQPLAKKKLSKVIKIVLTVFGVIFLLGAIGGVYAFMSTKQTVKQAEAFVAAFVAKDYDTAYTYFSPELQASQPIEQFKGSFSAAPFDASCKYKITSRATSASTETGSQNELKGNLVCADASYPMDLTFIDTDSGEKLISYSIRPPVTE